MGDHTAVAQGSSHDLAPLSDEVTALLVDLEAPLRLVAHLRAVHDVAVQLLAGLQPAVDRDAVLFGAATHDVGKVLYPSELREAGAQHEAAGCQVLLDRGFPPHLARFCRTHADPGDALEDVLVALADKLWKGRRAPELEACVVAHLAHGRDPWVVWVEVDDLCERLAEAGHRRLAFQNQFP